MVLPISFWPIKVRTPLRKEFVLVQLLVEGRDRDA
jgi:hypothetical protein